MLWVKENSLVENFARDSSVFRTQGPTGSSMLRMYLLPLWERQPSDNWAKPDVEPDGDDGAIQSLHLANNSFIKIIKIKNLLFIDLVL